MATEESSERFHQNNITVVKEEPPEEEEPEFSSFCYETVTKEEVDLNYEAEHAEDQSGSDELGHGSTGMELLEPVESEQILKEENENQEESGNPSKNSKKNSKERPYKCTKCNRTFNEMKNLTGCVKRHNAVELGLYTCKFCGKRCCTKQTLRKHEGSHEKTQNKPPPLIVFGSRDGSLNRKSINQSVSEDPSGHSTDIAKELPFKCSICNKTFDQPADLQMCVKKHNSVENGVKCETCGKEFRSKSNFSRHKKLYCKTSFKCSTCNKTYKGQHKANICERKHLAMRLGLYQCKFEFCKKRVGTLIEHQRHELTHTRLVEPKVKPETQAACGVCGKRFVQKGSIKKHMMIHEQGEFRFGCRKCDLKFSSRAEQQSHIQRHDWDEAKHKYYAKLTKDEDGNHLCTICNHSFVNVRWARIHVFKHKEIDGQIHNKPEGVLDASDGESPPKESEMQGAESKIKQKPFVCDICGIRFVKKHNIEKHLQAHQDGKTWRLTCHRCNETFATRGELSSHIQRHDWDERKLEYFAKLVKNDDGKHLCTICNRTFVNMRWAKCHVFKHMEINEFNTHNQVNKSEEAPMEDTDENQPKKCDTKKSRQMQTLKDVKTEPNANSSSFSYEAVIKEELIIEDASRSSAEESQLTEYETESQQHDESSAEQSMPNEDEVVVQLNDTKVGRSKLF